MPHNHAVYDPVLDELTLTDIARYRFKRSVFAILSIVLITTEMVCSVGLLLASLNEHHTEALVFAAVSAFVLSVDISFGIRERASSHHATLSSLRGIRSQMRYSETSPLWQEFHQIKSYDKISYIEAACDVFSRSVPAPITTSVVTHTATRAATHAHAAPAATHAAGP